MLNFNKRLHEERAAREAQFKELREKLDEQSSRLQMLLQEHDRRLRVLEAESEAYPSYVVDSARKRLEHVFGTKAETQPWSEYLTKALERNPAFFIEHELHMCMDLLANGQGKLAKGQGKLAKGQDTIYEAGNVAAHNPDLSIIRATVDAAAVRDGRWACVWRFASADS